MTTAFLDKIGPGYNNKPINYTTTLDGINVSHKVAVVAEVLDPTSGPVRLNGITGGTVSMDSTAEARARFTLELPATDELVPRSPQDLLAPFGNELRISRGIERYDHVDLVRLGTFRIDAARVSGDSLVLEGLDRTGWFIDTAFEWSGQFSKGMKVVDVISAIIGSRRNVTQDFFDHNATLPFPISYDIGEDAWAYAQGLGLSLGCELFFDRVGTCRLRPIPTEFGNPVAEIAEGEGGMLLSVDRSFDRAEAWNIVFVTGNNPGLEELGEPVPRASAEDGNPFSPTYIYGRFGRKPYFYDNPFCGNAEQCGECAKGILARSKGAPDAINFGQICDPTRSPSDVVRVVRKRLGLGGSEPPFPNDPQSYENHVLDTVEIPLDAAGEMTCHTRAVDLTSF